MNPKIRECLDALACLIAIGMLVLLTCMSFLVGH